MSPSDQIDQLIAGLGDWRGPMLARLRRCILMAAPGITEDWRYRGSPVWSACGQLVVGNAHKNKVKLTFPSGAHLADPDGLFNNGLGGKAWRAIDLFAQSSIDDAALTRLVGAAVAYNRRRAEPERCSHP